MDLYTARASSCVSEMARPASLKLTQRLGEIQGILGVTAALCLALLMTVSTDLRESLTQRYGQLLTLEEVAQVLRYPSIQAARKAHSRGQLPIRMFRMGPRRGLFASAGALADYLSRLEESLNGGSPMT